MGIESDQVVYEYLSRVGDVAQQRQLSSATRMRLVSDLRNEIDRRRARAPVDSPAAVRRILDRLGTPDEIVEAAAGDRPEPTAPPAPPAPSAPQAPPASSVPVQRDRGEERPKGAKSWWAVAFPRQRSEGERPAAPDVPSPPHPAGAHGLGDGVEGPDWWRRSDGLFGLDDSVPGFVGGIEIPAMLKPPSPAGDAQAPAGAGAAKDAGKTGEAGKKGGAGEAGEAGGTPVRRRRFLPLPPLRAAAGWSNPLLLGAAACLAVGALIGDWRVMAVGWLIAYVSRRLTDLETKWAVMVLPGLAVVAGFTWLWGRSAGRWGDPIAEGGMNDAVDATLPWVIRGAAVASALFLLWRSQRRK
ncbi:hypothetical protein [Streptomyces sp. NPDC003247]|uniref:hypothetical protein n=1 Tax=Streptomyces sp. NPDC003247 TaxID=3364677 RepID=UPI0036777602